MRELTLAELQRQTGVHFSTISQIERGMLVPNPPAANALAGYFGRSIDELLGPAPTDETL